MGITINNLIKNLGCHSIVGVAPVNGKLLLGDPKLASWSSCATPFNTFYHDQLAVKPSNRKPIPKRESSAAASVFPERGQVQHRNGVVVLYGAGALCARATVRRQRSGARVLAFDALHQ